MSEAAIRRCSPEIDALPTPFWILKGMASAKKWFPLEGMVSARKNIVSTKRSAFH